MRRFNPAYKRQLYWILWVRLGKTSSSGCALVEQHLDWGDQRMKAKINWYEGKVLSRKGRSWQGWPYESFYAIIWETYKQLASKGPQFSKIWPSLWPLGREFSVKMANSKAHSWWFFVAYIPCWKRHKISHISLKHNKRLLEIVVSWWFIQKNTKITKIMNKFRLVVHKKLRNLLKKRIETQLFTYFSKIMKQSQAEIHFFAESYSKRALPEIIGG